MLGIIWHFIDISIPWYVKLVAAAVIVGVLLATFRAYWKYILAGAAVVGGAILLNRAKQQGYAERKVDEKQAEDKAVKTVDAQRTDAQALPDKKLDEEVDKWSH